MPQDPFGEDTSHHDDACVAVGTAVLEILVGGSKYAIVTPNDEGGYDVMGDDEDG